MRESLAWLNLTHNKSRAAVAVAGVAFAVVLMFVQLGFRGAADNTATVVYDQLRFDAVILSARYLDINRADSFPQPRLYQALADDAVTEALPVQASFTEWRNPEKVGPYARRAQSIMVLGFRPGDAVFRRGGKGLDEQVARLRDELRQPGKVLIDTRSHADFGPKRTGQTTEAGGQQVQIAGRFTLGTGFGANGLLLVSDATFFLVNQSFPAGHVSLGLLRLRPGAAAREVADRLNRTLPPDVVVLTRDELLQRERSYWVGKTALGVIFTLGVLVAFAVGIVFVYQVVGGDVGRRLHEFATLKAMGYSGRSLGLVVLQQALFVAVLGYLAALPLSAALYAWLRDSAGLPVVFHAGRACFVLALTVGMCSLSGLLALRKLRVADPVDLF